MKKTITICILACVALLAPAVATASTRSYSGSIAPAGTLSFNLKSKNGKKNVVKLTWGDLPVDCSGVAKSSDGKLTFKVPVRKKGFKAVAVLGKSDAPQARAVISGSFKGKNAKGKIDVSGSKVPTTDGNSGDCDSGKLDWSASR